MKKSLAILSLLVVASTAANAQCTATLSNFHDTEVFSGSAVVPSSITHMGAGDGFTGAANGGFEQYVESISGDFTLVAELNSVTGSGPTPKTALFSDDRSPACRTHHTVRIDYYKNSQGQLEADFLYQFPNCGTGYQSPVVIGSQIISSLPVTLKLARAGTTYTGYVALDNVNFTSLGSYTATLVHNPTLVGFATWSGDHTNLTTAQYANVSINGNAPTGLTDYHGGFYSQDVPGNGLPGFQAGQLYVGQDSQSGIIVLSGCSGGGNHPFSLVPSNNMSVVINPNTNPVSVLNSGTVANPTIPCDTSCSFLITNPYPGNTPWGPVTLIHGSPYNVISTTQLNIENSVGQLVIDLNPVVQTTPLNP